MDNTGAGEVRETQVGKAVNGLAGSVDRLSSKIESLFKRTENSRCPRPETPTAVAKKEEALCPLAGTIRTQQDRVECETERLIRLIEELEI